MAYSRYTVVCAHVLLSVAILGGLLCAMYFLWYPDGLFTLAGGWQGLRILAPIDLVLGPLLTLMFYRPGKKGVVRDLAMIGCVQIAALGYGLNAVYQQRPVALVFAEGEFLAVTPQDIDEANVMLRAKDYEPVDPTSISQARPSVVVAKPVPPEEYSSYVTSLFNNMPELALRSDRYETVEQHRDLLEAARVTPEQHGDLQSANWYRLKTKFGKGLVQVDLSSGRVLASISNVTSAAPTSQALNRDDPQREAVHKADQK